LKYLRIQCELDRDDQAFKDLALSPARNKRSETAGLV
jgi:hypothetical protein